MGLRAKRSRFSSGIKLVCGLSQALSRVKWGNNDTWVPPFISMVL